MRRLPVVEGKPLRDLDEADAALLRERLAALRVELRPRIPFLGGSDSVPVVQNLVGSVQVSSDLVVDVQPKTEPGNNWAAALIDLLVDDRVAFGGETRSAEVIPRTVLPEAFAALYAEQLDRAVRREGPLSLIHPHRLVHQSLVGRLDVSAWLTQHALDPTHFPQEQARLTVDNPFTSAMAWVAETLAKRTSDARVASRLRTSSARIRPGLPLHVQVDPGVALREIPPQWRAYGPAWATARAVIRRIAPLHRTGTLDGIGLAVEPWPLLERLLVRALDETARQSALEGVPVRAEGHGTYPLIAPITSPPTGLGRGLKRLHVARGVEPDGSLWLGDQVAATFEAKYSRPSPDAFRNHYFQALSTAAGMGSSVSVLIYPELSEPVSWRLAGFDGRPARLVAIGLDMYGYRRGAGDIERGARLLDVVRSTITQLNGYATTAE